MNPEQKVTDTARSLKIIAILSACVAFMLIGGALYIKYNASTGKEQIANIQAGEIAARNAIMKETNVDKLRATATRYAKEYADSCDQALATRVDVSNIALAISLLPVLILIRVATALKTHARTE
ncbi:MAG: hypothetical protein WCN98_13535 [Verrucomicrobiaceae bacterium]